MTKVFVRKYRIGGRKKEILAQYVHGAITVTEAARKLQDNYPNIDRYVASVLKRAAQEGKVDFRKLVKDY